MRALPALFCAGALTLAVAPAYAQSEGESLLETLARAATLNEAEQRSGLVGFVEDQLSSPDRQIRLTGIEGALSSNASIGQITFSDTEGIWLIIENAAIDWNQAALLLGRLEIRSLSADAITYVRNPVSTEEPSAPSPEAGGFTVPELPVAVTLDSLSVPRVSFGEDVFGLGSIISVAGKLRLEGGAIDTELDIERLDGPGGTLSLDLAYANQSREIDLNLELIEPENGIVANLLNIEGRPEIRLGLSGAGPIEDLNVALTLDADSQRVLTGSGFLNQRAEGLAISANLEGPIADILPGAYRDFFGENSALELEALMRDAGGIELTQFDLSGGQLSLTADGETAEDGFLRRLNLSGEIGSSDGSPVTLPFPGAATAVDRARFEIDFGGGGTDDWSGTLQMLGFTTSDFAAESLSFTAGGVATNLDDPNSRRITFNGESAVSGITAISQEIADALGTQIGLGIAGLWEAGHPITLAQLRILGRALLLEMDGTIEGTVFDGNIALVADTLAPFSGLAGRDLSGAIALNATGTVSPEIGGFDLDLNGTATNLTLDDPIADGLINGTAQLSGRIARTENGIEAEDFTLSTSELTVSADGNFASGAADFSFDATLADLAALSPDASGRLTVTGTAQGEDGLLDLSLVASVPEGTLSGRPLRDADLRFEGTSEQSDLTGNVTGGAFLDGHRVTLRSAVSSTNERLALTNIAFSAPGTDLSGNLTRLASGLMDGRLQINAPNIETAGALALVDARGSVTADIRMTPGDGTQTAFVTANLSGVVVDDIAVRSGRVEAAIINLFDVPTINGTVDAAGVAAAGVDIETLNLVANATGRSTNFSGLARLVGGTDASLAGSLAPVSDGYRVTLDNLAVSQGQLSARLASPATLTVVGESVQFSGVDLAVGSGRITATGTAGQALDIALNVTSLPLNIANTIVPDLRLSGTLSGSAQISGSASNPRAQFSLEAAGIGAAAIAEFGITPLSLSAQGSFADGRIALANARASGAQGLSATARGTIPLEGSGLDIVVNGSAPLSLANRFVADSGAQVSGTANLDARVTGRIDNPQFAGTLSVAGAEYVDPALSLRLTNINASAALSPSQVTINSASALLATGGSISATGTVALDGNLNSDLRIALNNARYADGNLLVATVNGNLAFSGPLTAGGLLSGAIAIDRVDITIPAGLGPDSTLIAVEHRNAPNVVLQTLARARADERAQGSTLAPAPIRLDVTVTAPNQIFLRGRGLDAEVGGSLRITGNANNVQPVGGFELIRGRLAILGQRIDFDSGTVTLIGDLDPFLNLVARTQGQDITVFVTVSGRASAPEIAFSSQPDLPQDEVLARLLFNRGVGELSPLQLAQLAAAAAELAGGGGNNSLMNSLRQATGLDDLDIITDSEGNAAVRAGRYIDDNIYLGVEAGAGGQSRVTIDLGITDSLRARGATGTDGDSSVGLFYEQDY